MTNNLEYIFNPKNIAIVGVSDETHKLGTIIYKNLLDGGFQGGLFPVNPKYQTLYNTTCYTKVSDIPAEIDQVVVVIPSKFVLAIVKDCAVKKVKTMIIISAGFGETGPEGKALENEILRIAKENNIRILGPNVLGALCPSTKTNSSWAQKLPNEGNIAFASQSGAFGTAVLDTAYNRGIGFSHFASLGNKIDIDELELFKYWNDLDNVKVISGYIEQIKYGKELVQFASSEKTTKPIIIYSPGHSQEARKAIASHTGSIAGSAETVKTAFKQAGIIEVQSTKELFNAFMAFSWGKLPKGKNIAVITNAGGPGIMATDFLVANGLSLALISDETKNKLKEFTPAAASLNNPIDILGDASAEMYSKAANEVIKDENVDAILFILTPQFITQIEETAKVIINLSKNNEKPVFPVFLGEKYVKAGLERLWDAQIPAFNDIDEAVFAIKKTLGFYDFQKNKKDTAKQTVYTLLKSADKGQYKQQLTTIEKNGQALPEEITALMATEVGLDIPKSKVCSTIDECKEFSENIYPVVMKAVNEMIAHKTDVKALYLNIKNPEELVNAFTELSTTIANVTGNQNCKVFIQEQIKYEQEFFIGANRDGNKNVYQANSQGFGHLMVFGQGGIYTEIYKDFANALVPATEAEIRQNLDLTKISKILKGARGKKPLAYEKVIEAIKAIQKMLILYPEIISIDLNPLLITESRAVAVDLKVFVD